MKKTLSLIIPVYNDYQGVVNTIYSLGNCHDVRDKWDISIVIVDDCSTKDSYDTIPNLFKDLYKITILKTEKNGGPGMARQQGIDYIKSDYFMLVDAGDLFINIISFYHLLRSIEENPQCFLFCGAHDQVHADYSFSWNPPSHNRIHGKIYKTSFVKSHNITFAKDAPFLNEDIAFNIACRLICDQIFADTGNFNIFEEDNSIISQTFNPTSLTRNNNCEFATKQNYGSGYNLVHAYNVALNNGVNFEMIKQRAYESFVYMYIFHCYSLIENMNVDIDMQGCQYFYDNFFKTLGEFDKDMLKEIYNIAMRETYSDPEFAYFANGIPPITIFDFINQLELGAEE